MPTQTMTAYETIRTAMARAFFASAWADQQEEKGVSLRGEILDQMPDDIDPAALHAADTLISGLIDRHHFTEPNLSRAQCVAALYMRAHNLYTANHDGADRECTPDNFGHYLAMQAMGSGVGLESLGDKVGGGFSVPYVEFGSHSLEKDY